MAKWAQLLFYQTDADCFFIVQSRCDLGPRGRFGIIGARSHRAVLGGQAPDARLSPAQVEVRYW
ncbi:hypothetical protein CUC44_07050 [Aeromonas lusitana]|uniref:Uncharacterized protein n=1 Tax=Aeromonas lusitana TaxID=931529 RepID=A0A2M8HBF4_9GAMM|nr:hypothetical protein CUC44_07050 [Aeromonas lusitana]